MTKNRLTRRQFITTASAGSVALSAGSRTPAYGVISGNAGKLAILGGTPVRQNKKWPEWPYWDQDVVNSIVETTKSRIWCRIQSKTGTVPFLDWIRHQILLLVVSTIELTTSWSQ